MTRKQIARQYRRQGYTYGGIAKLMNISTTWAHALCDDHVMESLKRTSSANQQSGTCPTCGGRMTNPQHGIYQGRGKPYSECISCYNARQQREAFARNVSDGHLRCRICKDNKPFSDYPGGVLAKYLERRSGKVPVCRSCNTKAKADYRKKISEPCVMCGNPRLGDHDYGRSIDTGLCLACYRANRKNLDVVRRAA